MLKAEIIGNLGADALVAQGNFKSFVSLNVAHSRKFTKQDGTPVNETIWVSVIINWDCSRLMPYLLKGTKVYVRGTIRLRIFTGHDGMQHPGLDIIADDIELCGSPKTDTAPPAAPTQQPVTPYPNQQALKAFAQNPLPF